ncbi:NADH oxidoreductase [Pantoea sp. BAV 3049]|uniref:NADH oxidoreductase n=1 Tax=Pantoea sp. BAV 3049 TaxID=2654188 RepID=UPI00131D5608|nr:NADH oxidoreductase [Pantoea sp. BAV 3049]
MSTHPLCRWRMQVHHVRQETSDVWTIALINADFYRWQAGQFALVQVANSANLRAYTLSSTPGQSEYITLTVRHIAEGLGSGWLTQHVRPGDYIWLSDPQGSFTCEQHPADSYLMLAAGCGITPIMSMCRWLRAWQPQCSVSLLYSVRSASEVIFAEELATLSSWLKLVIIAEDAPTVDLPAGRITREWLQKCVPDINQRTVMICGPQPYMHQMDQFARDLGAENIWQENFTAPDDTKENGKAEIFTLRSSGQVKSATFSAGNTLLNAMEKNQFSIEAACRSGVCGCCKTQILSGSYTTSSTQTLSDSEQQAGYVLACSCLPVSDIIIA